ncbi:MAG: hypothetical protein ACR2LC_09690 [Pyrinomonadaceae bacterium]
MANDTEAQKEKTKYVVDGREVSEEEYFRVAEEDGHGNLRAMPSKFLPALISKDYKPPTETGTRPQSPASASDAAQSGGGTNNSKDDAAARAEK